MWNWTMARRAVSDMWAFGQLNFEEVSRELAAAKLSRQTSRTANLTST